MKRARILFPLLLCIPPLPAFGVDYPYQTAEPQKTGWPLTEEERVYVLTPEHERRPGREANKHLPSMWPVVPSAGHWGDTAWLDTHAKLVEYVQANKGPIDILLVGDSLTQQWGSPLDTGIAQRCLDETLWRLQEHQHRYRRRQDAERSLAS